MTAPRQSREEKHNHGQRFVFAASSRLTSLFPRAGAHCLDAIILPLLSNPLTLDFFKGRNRRILSRVKSFRRILVISDIHIGDGIYLQSTLTGLRDFFPEAQIDYVVNKTVYPLIAGNPEATQIYPFLSGNGPYPPAESLQALQELHRKEQYDLCLNLCPFIPKQDITPGRLAMLNLKTQGPTILKNERRPGPINHFSYQAYRFTRDLLSLVATPVRAESFQGVRLTLSDAAVEQSERFVATAGLVPGRPVMLYNGDTASRFTLLPFERQADFLRRLAGLPVSILLNEGHSEAGIGLRLADTLPAGLPARVTIVPASLPLEAYAALIDYCDVFISGDTGPLHIAAARKYARNGGRALRNRTAVMSIFGATPARLSGYDSRQPGFLSANQDAPSWCYAAQSPCRNITCLNKMYKTCPSVRCFEETDLDGQVGRIREYLETLSAHQDAGREGAAGK